MPMTVLAIANRFIVQNEVKNKFTDTAAFAV